MDIQFRERSAEIVRTIDRAGLMAGSFREISMRTRDGLVKTDSKDEGPAEHASGVVKSGMAHGGYAARAAAGLVRRSKGGNGRYPGEDTGSVQRDGSEMPDISYGKEQNVPLAQRYNGEYNRRTSDEGFFSDSLIRRDDSDIYAGPARHDPVRIGAGLRGSQKVSGSRQELPGISDDRYELHVSSANRHEPPGVPAFDRYGLKKTANNRLKASAADDHIALRKRAFSIKRMTENRAGSGFLLMSADGSGFKNTGASDRFRKVLSDMAEGTRALFSSLTAGSIAALLVVVIMVLFGAALTFTEDGSRIEGTGDTAIVEVARAELGNVGGDKFWKWYGFSSHVDWCAIFCSWCADRCGYIDSGILPKFSVVGDGAGWFRARHRWSGRGYSPKPGDFIFFDFEQDGVLDHVGIVENCDGRVVTTIEGNSGDVCKRLSYRAGSPQIAGYGLMIRPVGNSARLIALIATELAYPDDTSEADYPGGRPTEKYEAALERAYPDRSSWGAAPKAGASCDVFVGTVLRTTGIAPDFPRGLSEQIPYLRDSDIFYDIGYNGDKSMLKPGDIVLIDYDTGAHICIIVNDRYHICEANYRRTYGITIKSEAGINWLLKNRSGSQYTKVYRVK